MSTGLYFLSACQACSKVVSELFYLDGKFVCEECYVTLSRTHKVESIPEGEGKEKVANTHAFLLALCAQAYYFTESEYYLDYMLRLIQEIKQLKGGGKYERCQSRGCNGKGCQSGKL